MSRHSLEPLSCRYSVAIGWDAPLASFFLNVEDHTVDDEKKDPILVWLGADGIGSEPEPDGVLEEASRWARVPIDLRPTLLRDRDVEGRQLDRPGVPLVVARCNRGVADLAAIGGCCSWRISVGPSSDCPVYNRVGNVVRKGKPMRTTAVISSKGQIVIPSTLRKRYGMKEGTTVVFQEEHGRLVLAASNYDAIFALAGSLRDFPLEEDLEQERKTERRREDRR